VCSKAPTVRAALVQIERLGLFPVMVEAAPGAAALTGRPNVPSVKFDWKALLPPTLRESMSQQSKPKLQELATFTQQLGNLLKSGMPLTVALNSMTHLESRGISAEVSENLRQDVMEGRSLSDAMAKQPRIFSDLYVNTVRAGESSGAFVDVLRRMAERDIPIFGVGAACPHFLGAKEAGTSRPRPGRNPPPSRA